MRDWLAPNRRLHAALAIASLFFAVQVLVVAWRRITFPYDVEWMEGGVLMQAERILGGESPYPAPSATFVPFLYPPLYAWLVAKLGTLFGVGYALGRSISFAAFATQAGIAAWVVQKVTRRSELAVLAIGLECALVCVGGGFHDLVRPDALAIALVASAAVLAWRGGLLRIACAGVLLAAACFAKQTALVMSFGVIAGVFLTRDRKSTALLVAMATVVGGATFFTLETATSSRFSFYVLGGHQSHAFLRGNFFFYAWREAIHLAPILLVLPAVWLFRAWPRSLVPAAIGMHLAACVIERALNVRDLPHMYYRDLWYPHLAWGIPPIAIATLALVATRDAGKLESIEPPLRYWGAVFCGALFAAIVGHATQWAFKNSLMPLATLGVPFVVMLVARIGESRWCALAVAIQLVALWEPIDSRAPGTHDRASWNAFSARLASVDGRVMVLGHPRLAWDSKRTQHLHAMGINDLAALGGVPDLEPRLHSREWAVIVTDADDWVAAPAILANDYEISETLDVVTPMKTGSRCRPAIVWRPKTFEK